MEEVKTHIFDVWDEVSRSLQKAKYIYLGFDFDGTLSPIVDDSKQASMQPEISPIIRDMVRHEVVEIAVFSGRSIGDLKERVNLEGIALSGDHGFVIEMPSGQIYKPKSVSAKEDLQQQIARIEAITSTLSGVKLEPKESSITVHYRQASDGTGEQLKSILETLVEGSAFQLQSGRMCWEINPRIHWNKGSAYNWVKHEYFSEDIDLFEMYIGDDRTDEDVFQAMPPGSYPVFVKSSERNKAINAQYYLNSQTEVYTLLDKIRHELPTNQ